MNKAFPEFLYKNIDIKFLPGNAEFKIFFTYLPVL